MCITIAATQSVRGTKVSIEVRRSPLHGYGCFATASIPAGFLVAKARILTFPPEETEHLFRTQLKHYLFYLRDGPLEEGPFWTALAMDPISFCKHSADSNCDFSLDEAAGEIALTTRRAIHEDEEVTIDYGDWAEEII